MSKRQPELLVDDIIQSASKILEYTNGMTFEKFIEDEKTLDAVIRNFDIIGEAANRLPDDFKDVHPTIEWYRIRGFRNRIVHDYMGVDFAIVWRIRELFLPELIAALKAIQ